MQNIDARGGLALYQKQGIINLEAQYHSKNDESNKQLEMDYIDLKIEQRKKSHSRQHIEKSQNMDLFIVDMEPRHKDTNPSMLIQNNKPIKQALNSRNNNGNNNLEAAQNDELSNSMTVTNENNMVNLKDMHKT